ncbi:MAG: DegV family protein [Anaerolineae bacterium]
MSKIAIVTDSTVCLPQELVQRYGIHVVPTWIHRGQEAFRDGVDITQKQVYQWLREGYRLTTSQPSVGEFMQVFKDVSRKVEAIVSILVSADISGVYSSGFNAAKFLEGFPIQVIDSCTISMAHGFVVLAAARAAQAGATFTEVVEAAKAMIPRVNLLAALETLECAHRSGRIPAITALVGSFLRINPVLEVKDGQITIFARVRTKRKALKRLLEEAKRRMGESLVHAAIIHGDVLEEAEGLKEQVVQRFDLAELYIADIPPVLAVHAGPGALGLIFYKED